MMRFANQMTLKVRITCGFVLLMLAALALIAAAEWLDAEARKECIISEHLHQEKDRIQRAMQQGKSPVMADDYQLYDMRNVAESFRHYGVGYHKVDGSRWHLLVFDIQGQPYFLVHTDARRSYFERVIAGYALLAILLCLLGAAWAGHWVSKRAMAPISDLVYALQRKQKSFPFLHETHEIGVLARAIAQRQQEAEQFLQREQCFVSDASHELRTSLAIVACAAETLVYQLPQDSALTASAARIVRTAQEMELQLESYLLLSREPQKLSRTVLPLLPLVQDCVDRCQPWVADKPVLLVLDVLAEARTSANAELVRSVVWNLVRNACQYTNCGEVRITLSARSLVVSDTGPGLPAGMDTQHFERFAPSASARGQGLGLSIAQRMVAHLGWRMVVHSSSRGCRFGLEW